MRTFHLLIAAFALVQVARYSRRALLFLFPSVRVTGEPGAPPRSARRLRAGAALERLGFVPLGIRRERSALGALAREGDAYASAEQGAFADVVEDGAGAAAVTFFTPFAGGAAVLTADHRRRSTVSPQVQAGGMPDAPLEAVLAAHRVAVQRFAAAHGAPSVAPELEARLSAARAWAVGEGRRELRRANAVAFGVVVLGVAILASAVNALAHGVK